MGYVQWLPGSSGRAPPGASRGRSEHMVLGIVRNRWRPLPTLCFGTSLPSCLPSNCACAESAGGRRGASTSCRARFLCLSPGQDEESVSGVVYYSTGQRDSPNQLQRPARVDRGKGGQRNVIMPGGIATPPAHPVVLPQIHRQHSLALALFTVMQQLRCFGSLYTIPYSIERLLPCFQLCCQWLPCIPFFLSSPSGEDQSHTTSACSNCSALWGGQRRPGGGGTPRLAWYILLERLPT